MIVNRLEVFHFVILTFMLLSCWLSFCNSASLYYLLISREFMFRMFMLYRVDDVYVLQSCYVEIVSRYFCK